MRENIGLFKAKRVDNKKWVEGYYVKCRSRHYILEQYNNNGYDERWELSEWSEINPETLCECSGLRDDNKQLIFEHDKLKDNKGQVGTVFYAHGRYAVNWHGVDGEYFVDTCFYGKIIGNKFSEVESEKE